MPVKNAEPFLEDCVKSILDQTESNWELIAVDDSSTDSSLETLQRFAKADDRIHVYQNNGSGIIAALRLAFGQSKGGFITRMDADDKMVPIKLATLKRNLKKFEKHHMATGQVHYFSEHELGDGYKRYEAWLNRLTSAGTNFQDIYKECVIPSPCWMVYRNDLIKCDGFNPDTYPEDYDLCFRFYRENLKVIPCNETLHLWRDHDDRSSRNDENYADNRFLELKVNWFLELDHIADRPLVLWGAGRKGKTIAKLLNEKRVQFLWVCNNPKKIGKHIHGIKMKSVSELKNMESAQFIVAVASPIEQTEIQNTLESEAFWFC